MTEPPPAMCVHEAGARKTRIQSTDSVSTHSPSICGDLANVDTLESMMFESVKVKDEQERRILQILSEVPLMAANEVVKSVPNTPKAPKPTVERKSSLPATRAPRTVAPSAEDLTKPAFVCDADGCDWSGRTRTSWRSHRIQKHPEMKKSCRPIMCSFCPPEKDANHGNMLRYRRHLLVDHGFQQFALQKDVLPDKDALKEWMDRVRISHSVKFVTWGSAETHRGGVRVRRYYCSMSGMVMSKSDTHKTGRFCTCTLKVSEKEDGLAIEYCLVHSGHDDEQDHGMAEPSSTDHSTPPIETPALTISPDNPELAVEVPEPEVPTGYINEVPYQEPAVQDQNGPVYHDLKPVLNGRWGEEYPSATEAMFYTMDEIDESNELAVQAQMLSERLAVLSNGFNSALSSETQRLLTLRIKELSELINSVHPDTTYEVYSPKRRKLCSSSL